MKGQLAYAKIALIPVVSLLLLNACGGGGGGNDAPAAPTLNNAWTIDPDLVVDGGPGRDGIPALESPVFEPIGAIASVGEDDLVIAVQFGTETKVYPHDIMDYHEVVNDTSGSESFVMSYCPLTGSAIGWEVDQSLSNKTFGVSGLLFNSNLILFDRETDSLWSQVLQESINGERIRERPQQYQVLETTKATIAEMYPDAVVMTRTTGHDRPYDDYPYGSYKRNSDLLFPVESRDLQLHPKTRVLVVESGNIRLAFQIEGFNESNHVISEQLGETPMVIIGNSSKNFAVAFERTLPDAVVLDFTAVDDPVNPSHILIDSEGTIWNSFGTAISGPRAGAKLTHANSYIAYWFTLAAFYREVSIFFNPG